MKKYLLTLAAVSFLFTSCQSTPEVAQSNELIYTAGRLKIMDLDQMTDIMHAKVREFKRSDNSQALKDALLIAFSRPDEDSGLEKIISIVQTPLDDNDLWEGAMDEMVDRSIAGVKNDGLTAADQVTYGNVLENVIAQMKPDFVKQYKSPGFESRTIEKIAAADLEFSKAAAAERKLNLMKGNLSPSLVAQKLIERREEAVKKSKK